MPDISPELMKRARAAALTSLGETWIPQEKLLHNVAQALHDYGQEVRREALEQAAVMVSEYTGEFGLAAAIRSLNDG